MKKILIVEDDEAIRLAIKELLEDNGYEVAEAGHGDEAINYLKGTQVLPDLIILDLMMPVKDGFTFREEQESDPRLSHIPVVIMSADGQVRAKQFRVRAKDYIRKPVDINTMLDAVKRQLP